MPRDVARAELSSLSAWVDQCGAAVRDALARPAAPEDRTDLLRWWAVTLCARARVARLRAGWAVAEARDLVAASRQRRPTRTEAATEPAPFLSFQPHSFQPARLSQRRGNRAGLN
jgi:hypothetical protein